MQQCNSDTFFSVHNYFATPSIDHVRHTEPLIYPIVSWKSHHPKRIKKHIGFRWLKQLEFPVETWDSETYRKFRTSSLLGKFLGKPYIKINKFIIFQTYKPWITMAIMAVLGESNRPVFLVLALRIRQADAQLCWRCMRCQQRVVRLRSAGDGRRGGDGLAQRLVAAPAWRDGWRHGWHGWPVETGNSMKKHSKDLK